MSVNKAELASIFSFLKFPCIDREEQEILRRLLKYGIRGTGNKSTDRAMLHELELRDAKKEDAVTSEFLTVGKNEQEKIQDKKKERKAEAYPDIKQTETKGAKTLGEQIYLAIQMKKNIEDTLKKKKSED